MMSRRVSLVSTLALSAGLCIAAAGSLAAQHEEPPPPAAYALQNASVIHADGRRREGVTLVVRGAFVETLETGAEVPADALELEGDSLVIYPGMVDAWGQAELDLPEGPDRDEVLPWDPPRIVQGFTPHRRVVDVLSATGSTLQSRRRAGVVASGVFPAEGLAGGIGAVLIHRRRAETPRELVARPEAGLAMSFHTSSAGYPSTLFGVIAYLRQAFADARRLEQIRSAWGRDPSGITLPAWDPDYQVLRRTAGRQLPVYFAAEGAEEIRRVLGLADELGFAPVIVGGGEAWKVADELAARDVPVIVSLDFPEPGDWDPEADTAGTRLEPAAAREKERLEDLYANPARLAEAGVTFALSGFRGGDLREGVRTVMEYGLPEERALEAVTSTPSTLLGVPSLSRIAPGTTANLVVTDGPIFGEETRVRYTFVEGALEEGSGGDGPGPGDEPPGVDVTGSWSMEISVQGQSIETDLTLEQQGALFTGTLRGGPFGEARVSSGVVSGNDVRFNIVIQAGPETLELRARGTAEGDRMRGSGQGGEAVGSFDFTATRTPGSGGLR